MRFDRFSHTIIALVLFLLLLVGCDAPLSTPQPIPTTVPLPMDWPMPALTRDQVATVRACDLDELTKKRYPESQVDVDDLEELETTYAPRTSCDWAVLAAAYAQRTKHDEKLPEPAKQAFRRAISDNHGYLFTQSLFYAYFDQARLVEPPPFAQQEIVHVDIQYSWRGMGENVDYKIEISQANTRPVVSGVEKAINLDSHFVQALGPALTDLLPVDASITLAPCTDNHPNWVVSIEFEDGTLLNMTTTRSNFIYLGGPWQTRIDGQQYIQVSFDFARAIRDLFEVMDLPLGEPGGMHCFPRSVLDKAFP